MRNTSMPKANKIGIFFLFIFLISCRGSTRSKPPIHLVNNMDNVARCDPQEPSELFANHRCMQHPPIGTISTTQILPDDSLMIHGKQNNTFVSSIPTSLNIRSHETFIQLGQSRFDIFCSPCHGENGFGDGLIAQSATNWTITSLYSVRHNEALIDYPIGRIYDVISNGYGTMPSFRSQTTIIDRWAIAAYLKELQTNDK